VGKVLDQWRLVLQVMGLVTFANVIFYLAFVYLVDLAGQKSGQAAAANTIATVIQTAGLFLVIWGGHLADRHGMMPVNRWGNALLILMTPIALLIGQQGQLLQLGIAELLLVAPVMVTMGAQGVLGVMLVPERQRCAVFSIAYSLAMALFAGTSPLVASWLAEQQRAVWIVPYTLIYGAVAMITVQRIRPVAVR
jgi:MHS family proline/betaine transporter-like MFS transporter